MCGMRSIMRSIACVIRRARTEHREDLSQNFETCKMKRGLGLLQGRVDFAFSVLRSISSRPMH